MTVVLSALALLLAVAPVVARADDPPPDPTSCPTPFPVAELRPGMQGLYGLTVTKGTTPERFSVEVLDVIPDGVAPGVAMIAVEAHSPAIDKYGVWAGISGSPVYAPDGRWVGAVAYGFSGGTTPKGGLAAAEDMMKVLDYGTGTATELRARRRVPLPGALRAKVTADREVTAEQAAAGLVQLPVPLAVSGLSAQRIDKLGRRLTAGNANLKPYRAASVGGGGAPVDPSQIVPGGNFAAAVSYGDVTAGAVGTTSAVCNGVALAFGHPFNVLGSSSYSAHTASAVTLIDDPVFGSYKLANIGGVAGTVDQDRRSAIRAPLGQGPAVIPVTAKVTDVDTHQSREGSTQITDTRFAHLYAPIHLLADQDRVLDRIGSGRADVTWTATGTTADGTPWTLTRTNRFAYDRDPSDPFDNDISYLATSEMFDQLFQLQRNRLTTVRFTGVSAESTFADEFRGSRLGMVEVKLAGGWVKVDARHPIPAHAGVTANLRATLTPDRGVGPTRTVVFGVAIPRDRAGQTGTLNVSGGASAGGDEPPVSDGPKTFDELLASLRDAPRNNEVLGTLAFDDLDGPTETTKVRRTAPEIVTGGLDIPVQVR